MHLTPREIDKLMLHQAGSLSQKRYCRGLRLNINESIALISSQLLEFIRDGKSYSELMDLGKRILGLDDVMPRVDQIIDQVQVEGTFPDGTKLVTIHQPICRLSGEPELALYGSGLKKMADTNDAKPDALPGEFIIDKDLEIQLNAENTTLSLTVLNTGDRPIQVGSHYHFLETNKALRFDRQKTYGFRLDIPAGTAVRFEPGESKVVQLVEFSGHRNFYGGNALVDGKDIDDNIIQDIKTKGFLFDE
jgi:urease subunit gamma/beta